MIPVQPLRYIAATFVMILAAGCAVPGKVQRTATAEETAELAQVKSDYAAGRYGEVIRRVARSDTLAGAPDAERIEDRELAAQPGRGGHLFEIEPRRHLGKRRGRFECRLRQSGGRSRVHDASHGTATSSGGFQGKCGVAIVGLSTVDF